MAERTAIDFSAAQIDPQAIRQAGYEAVINYVSEARPSASWMKAVKPMSAAYAAKLRAAGIEIVSNYQYGKTGDATPSDWRGGYDAGVLHGKKALANHFAAGGPGWRPCYAPCDDNPTADEVDRLVLPFIQGWASVWGKEWTGIYCNRQTWERLKARGAPVTWFWQHFWDGGSGDKRARIHPDARMAQLRIDQDQVGGVGVDHNVLLADDYGQWSKSKADTGAPGEDPAPEPIETFPITKYRMAEVGHNKGHKPRRRVYFHTSEGVDWKSTARGTADYQIRMQNGSYHLLIDDNEIIQTVDLNDTAWGVLNDNGQSIQICLILSSGSCGSGACASESKPKSREQWLEHEKMFRMARYALAWVLDWCQRNGEPIPLVRVNAQGVGRNEKGISSHNNYTYGSKALYGWKDGTHWDCPDSLPYDYLMGGKLAPPDPDAFPLPGGYYYGPLEGPEESISGQAGEPKAWIDGLKRWQTAVGIPATGVWDTATRQTAQLLQIEKKWQKAPGDGFVYLGEWNAVIREKWTPTIVEVEGMARKTATLTGPKITGQWGVDATDLGVMAQAPDGKLVAMFGDTFREKVGGPDWRSPVALIGSYGADGNVVWDRAGGPDPKYARQLWEYRHVNKPVAPSEISTVIPSDVVTVGDTMYLHAMVNRGFGNVAWTEIWRSRDNGQTWQHVGEKGKLAGNAGAGLYQCVTWDFDPADGWVYVMSTGFQRNKGLVLRRCRPEQIEDQSSWQTWKWSGSQWGWVQQATSVAPSVITPRGETWGEISLRKLDGGWVLGGFLSSRYEIAARVIDSPVDNLHKREPQTLVRGVAWGMENHERGLVAQLYGGYVLPGSKLSSDGGIKLAVSQWNTGAPDGLPYQVMQFSGTLAAVNDRPRVPPVDPQPETPVPTPGIPSTPGEDVSAALSDLRQAVEEWKKDSDAKYAELMKQIDQIGR